MRIFKIQKTIQFTYSFQIIAPYATRSLINLLPVEAVISTIKLDLSEIRLCKNLYQSTVKTVSIFFFFFVFRQEKNPIK